MRLVPRFLSLRFLCALVLLPATVSCWANVVANPTIANPTPLSFGSQGVGVARAQTTVTFTISSGGALAATPLVLTQGAQNLDFTLGTGSTCTGSVSTGTCTVNVVFTPRARDSGSAQCS